MDIVHRGQHGMRVIAPWLSSHSPLKLQILLPGARPLPVGGRAGGRGAPGPGRHHKGGWRSTGQSLARKEGLAQRAVQRRDQPWQVIGYRAVRDFLLSWHQTAQVPFGAAPPMLSPWITAAACGAHPQPHVQLVERWVLFLEEVRDLREKAEKEGHVTPRPGQYRLKLSPNPCTQMSCSNAHQTCLYHSVEFLKSSGYQERFCCSSGKASPVALLPYRKQGESRNSAPSCEDASNGR